MHVCTHPISIDSVTGIVHISLSGQSADSLPVRRVSRQTTGRQCTVSGQTTDRQRTASGQSGSSRWADNGQTTDSQRAVGSQSVHSQRTVLWTVSGQSGSSRWADNGQSAGSQRAVGSQSVHSRRTVLWTVTAAVWQGWTEEVWDKRMGGRIQDGPFRTCGQDKWGVGQQAGRVGE